MTYLRKVVLAAKSFPAEKVLEHHEKFSTMSVQEHVKEIILSHPKWVLQLIPVSEFRPRHTVDSLVEKYADRKTKAPAIIAVKDRHYYEVLDGAHRLQVAIDRDEEDIMALVPIDQTH